MVLYKYCPVDRLSILEEHRIYFTRPSVLNDPFEGCVGRLDTPNLDLLGEAPWFSRLLQQARSQHAEHAITAAIDSLVVLSLSSRADSLLMWSHYADWHAGFVIGLDIEHPALTAGDFRHLAQVRYLHDRPRGTLDRQVLQDELMLTKSVEWHYEAEWRMIDSSFAAAGDPLRSSPDSWPFPLPPDAVRHVIVGCRAGDGLVRDLEKTLAAPEYAHVERFRTRTDPDKYRLNVVEGFSGEAR